MQEHEQRARFQHFLSELAILGSLQGFHYFQPWLRGREELLLTVVNDDLVGSLFLCLSLFVFSLRLFYIKNVNVDSHLLPASPSEREIAVPEMNCTLFLLAGYAKYGQPYVWIRSNHERLVNVGGTDTLVKDTPMKLKSITDWVSTSQGTHVWDVVSELVGLCTMPPPDNPFSLDMRYLQTLSLPERFLVTGALLNFLEMIVVQGSREEPFYDLVVEELKPLRRLHFQSLSEVQRFQGSDRTPSPLFAN
uniref:Uncharacterized LOC107683551 n=1 Tax=Sinocyclocheilus anshuiensis TaxID=1608454 RepID=A0A671P7G1_9TELE